LNYTACELFVNCLRRVWENFVNYHLKLSQTAAKRYLADI
jgi:hypothetical protein